MQDIWLQLRAWRSAGERFAIATVTRASKPSPRGVGATLAVSEDGLRFIGSVSAGCVESEVIEAAVASMQDGRPRWLSFGPGQGFPWEIELSCGGKIETRVEPYPSFCDACEAAVAALERALEGDRSGALISGQGWHVFLDRDGGVAGPLDLAPREALEIARERFENGEPTAEFDVAGERVLFRPLERRRRLFVIGASHIGLHLVGLAKSLRYEVTVVDPRESYAQAERFWVQPDALEVAWPTEVLRSSRLGRDDVVVALTHDPKIDDLALAEALRSDCGYVGALGSRRSHAARLKRLEIEGFDPAALKRIHGPVGIDIGSRTPAEIAVSVVAHLIQIRNKVIDSNG